MDDKEFLALDLEGAKEYMLAYATSVKTYEKDIAAARAELALWTGRVGLAESKGAAELAAAARAKAAEIEGKVAALEGERASLAAELRRIRERLPYLKARERSVNPDRLLAELQLLTGELLGGEAEAAPANPNGTDGDQSGAAPAAPRSEAAIARDLGKLEAAAAADAELEALKRKMGGNQ
ncbi:MAG: hypothetical protein JNG85_10595 [Spirochaetaceae bacterium]|nr:hypothetical protein [Spirochaetaceae bacterium]